MPSSPGGGDNVSAIIAKVNKLGRDLGIGGVFHGAIQIADYEWSFGWCEVGSGVYVVEARKNPMYLFRETLDLGPTGKTKQEVRGGPAGWQVLGTCGVSSSAHDECWGVAAC